MNPARRILESPWPVRPLSLPEFLRWCLLSRRLWFVVCFGKFSLSDIPIRNKQAASDRASAVAKVPSKWRGRRKRTEFRPCWCVKCRMSLHPVGNIQLRVVRRPVDLRRCWRFPYMQLLWWLHRRRWDQLCTAGTSHTKHQSSLIERVLHVSRWDFHLPKYGNFENWRIPTGETTEEIQAMTPDVLARTSQKLYPEYLQLYTWKRVRKVHSVAVTL